MNLTERIRRMNISINPLFVDITHSKLSKTLQLAELLLDYTTVGTMAHATGYRLYTLSHPFISLHSLYILSIPTATDTLSLLPLLKMSESTSNTLQMTESLHVPSPCAVPPRVLCTDIMVHLSMTNMTKKDLRHFLDECRDIGIRNILAIRGDPPRGYDSWIAVDDDLQHCADLVRFIRKEYGDYFSVFVGGYPEGHHNAPSLQQDIVYLKEKVDAGADGIITQLFYDTSVFLQFVAQCRAAGISVPIIPGLMPMQTYGTFVRVVSFTNITVPAHVWTELGVFGVHDILKMSSL